MATLATPHNYEAVYTSGVADKVVLFGLKNVTTGDTADLAAWLSVIDRAAVIGADVFVEIAASWTGTVVTMPSGLSANDGYMLAWGSGA